MKFLELKLKIQRTNTLKSKYKELLEDKVLKKKEHLLIIKVYMFLLNCSIKKKTIVNLNK